MHPATLAIMAGAAAASAAIGGYKNKRLQKKQSKEMKKQTEADLQNAQLNKSYETEAQGVRSSKKLGRRRSDAMKNTAASVRGALL